jgi:ubiquinone biosynthesis protein Coq4
VFDRSEVKLPAHKPDGTPVRKHTLIWALQDALDLGVTLADVARTMSVTPQTLWIWKERAKKERHFLLPAEQVRKLSEATGVPPYYFRPDLWPSENWRF